MLKRLQLVSHSSKHSQTSDASPSRRDSDIYRPYGSMAAVTRQLQDEHSGTGDVGVAALLQKKTKLALWIVSNCELTPGAQRRMKLSEDFAKTSLGHRFDRRGGCFDDPVPRERLFETISEYKFYFSWENAHLCRDYVTEKLFRNAFLAGAVPVVWGAAKSDYLVPAHSVIFADDYATADELAGYLRYLDGNATAYREYFKWRSSEMPAAGEAGSVGVEKLCDFLHDSAARAGTHVKIISDLSGWFYGTENAECKH